MSEPISHRSEQDSSLIPAYTPYKGDKVIAKRGHIQTCTIVGCKEIIFQEGRCLDHWLIFDRQRVCEVLDCGVRPEEDQPYCLEHRVQCHYRICHGRVAEKGQFCKSCLKRRKRKAAPKCSFKGCRIVAVSHGLCGRHRDQQKAGQPLTPLRVRTTCREYECKNKTAHDFCREHNKQCEEEKCTTRISSKRKRCKICAKKFRERAQCSFEGCDKKSIAKGLCKGHYSQQKKGQELRPLKQVKHFETCTFLGCCLPHHAKGYCEAHYTQQRRGQELRPLYKSGQICKFEGCINESRALGYCGAHYNQMRSGKPLHPLPAARSARCSFSGCDRKHAAQGYCDAHYQQLKSGKQLTPIRAYGKASCKLKNCNEKHFCKGYCKKHYHRHLRGKTCIVECRNEKGINGLCPEHQHLDPTTEP